MTASGIENSVGLKEYPGLFIKIVFDSFVNQIIIKYIQRFCLIKTKQFKRN